MGEDHPAASRKVESRTSREVRLSFKLVSSFVLCVRSLLHNDHDDTDNGHDSKPEYGGVIHNITSFVLGQAAAKRGVQLQDQNCTERRKTIWTEDNIEKP